MTTEIIGENGVGLCSHLVICKAEGGETRTLLQEEGKMAETLIIQAVVAEAKRR